ncbi:MAG TPA: hypothetical protein VEX86_19380 [Longimicrobium sp.]|nr:hypothetical protein [Longimicrobium sp.]
MTPKRKLQLDTLAVESFHTSAPETGARGTVQAHQDECTAPATCKCATSLYACGTIAYTRYSCPPSLGCT